MEAFIHNPVTDAILTRRTIRSYTEEPLTDEEIATMQDLENAVNAAFGESLAKKLLTQRDESGKTLYKEMNGRLYVRDFATASSDYFGSETLTCDWESAAKISVRVDTERLSGGSVQRTFCLEQVDGSWLFTDFDPVY